MQYELFASVFGIIFGIVVVIFRKQVIQKETEVASKRKGYFFYRLATYPRKDAERMTIISCLGIIILSVVKLISLLH
jgi:hypothetical protein